MDNHFRSYSVRDISCGLRSMLFFSDVIGNFVIRDRLCSLDRKHKGKRTWFGFQKPFVERSVA